MAYPHKDEMVSVGGRWWWFPGAQIGAESEFGTDQAQHRNLSYNSGVRHRLNCKSRAAWRLRPAKPAERLSAYYRFGCEYGSSLMTCWQGGGTGPLYVCDVHATTLSSREIREASIEKK